MQMSKSFGQHAMCDCSDACSLPKPVSDGHPLANAGHEWHVSPAFALTCADASKELETTNLAKGDHGFTLQAYQRAQI